MELQLKCIRFWDMAFMKKSMEMPWLSNSNSGVFLSKEKSTCLLTIKVWHYNMISSLISFVMIVLLLN